MRVSAISTALRFAASSAGFPLTRLPPPPRKYCPLVESLESRNLLTTVWVTANDSQATEPDLQDQNPATMADLAEIVFHRSDTSGNLCVGVKQNESSTASPADYHLTSLTGPDLTACPSGSTLSVLIPAGSSTATVSLVPDWDGAYEDDEVANIIVDQSGDYTVDPPSPASVTILDNSQLLSVTAGDSASEAGPTPGTFTFTRTYGGDISSALGFSFNLTGTADLDTDYTFTGFSEIPANETSATITINPIPDSIREGSETVVLTVMGGIGSQFKLEPPGEATITISDPPQQSLLGCPTCSGGAVSGKADAPSSQRPSTGASNSGGDPGESKHPVRYADGAVFLSSSDLNSDADGVSWGVTRDWTNAPGYATSDALGTGMTVDEQPVLIQVDGTNLLAVLVNGFTSYYFELSGSAYVARGFYQDQLTYEAASHQYVFTDTNGAQFRFFDFTGTPARQRGQLASYTDPGGNLLTLHYDATSGQLLYAERQNTGTGPTVTERFSYDYIATGSSARQVRRIKLERDAGSGFATVREADYAYYGTDEAFGNARDLKTVTITDGTAVIDTMYYRYYTQADINGSQPGYVHGLKFVFGTDSYARLVAALGSEANAQQAADDDVRGFADNYFQYGDAQHPQYATLEKAQGAGCSTCNAGLGTFAYTYNDRRDDPGYQDGFNSWAMETTETLPDGNQNIVYTNYLGEVMLNVFHDAGGGKDWRTFYRYDNATGQILYSASPAAVNGYDPNAADLLDFDGNSSSYLEPSAGVITTFAYYGVTNAGTTTAGGAAGYLESITIQNGASGSPVPQAEFDYIQRVAHNATIFLVADSTVFMDDAGNGALTTGYEYSFYSGQFQPQWVTATNPSLNHTTVVYDTYNRPVWTKDADDFIDHIGYDPATGAVATMIVDVDTGVSGGGPLNWTTPPGGGLGLTTSYQVDPLGRPTKTTDAKQNETYAVYDDIARELRVYPGWHQVPDVTPAEWTTTGPIVVVRQDRATAHESYVESLMMSAQTFSTSSPDGDESIANLQSLSRTYYNDGGQATETDDFSDLSGVAYPGLAHTGTPGTNYDVTDMGYDQRGRLSRVKSGDGTIYRTVYDGLGRPISEWQGTSDAVSGYWSPTNPGGMVLQKQYTYDHEGEVGFSGVGDSFLTSVKDGMGQETKFGYDFRGRVTSTTLPDPDGETGYLASPVYQTDYDNLGRVISQTDPLGNETTTQYDDPNRTVTTTQPYIDAGYPITVQVYNTRGLLASLNDPDGNTTTWGYDGAGRMTTETNALNKTRTYTYDAAGNLQDRIDRNGRDIRYDYDAANRPKHEYWYDTDLTTLVRTFTYTYDDAGRLYQATDPNSTYGYNYDALGRTTHQSQSIAGLSPLLGYNTVYDGGKLDSLSATIGNAADYQNTYQYTDPLNRLSSIVQQSQAGGNALAAKRADFHYNDASQITQIGRFADTAGTDLVINSFFAYDDMGRLTQLTHTMASTASAAYYPLGKARYTFGYDDDSRIISGWGDNYGYDATGQLTTSYNSGNHTYDLNGNRYDYYNYIGTNNQLLYDIAGNSYTYDDEGNLTSKTDGNGHATTYTYDWRNRLVSVSGWTGGPYATDTGQGGKWGWGNSNPTGTFTVGPTIGEGTSWGWGGSTGTATNFSDSVDVTVTSATEGNAIVVSFHSPNGAIDVNYLVGDVSALGYNSSIDYSVSGGRSGTITLDGSGNATLYIDTLTDLQYENTESLYVSVNINNDQSGALSLEGDIYDADATSNQTVNFSVSAPPVVEGHTGNITVTAPIGTLLEWWTDDYSADGMYAVNFTPGQGRMDSTSFSVQVTAYDGANDPSRRSFEFHVRAVEDPDNTEIVAEVDILPRYNPTYEFGTVEYTYDYLNQMVSRSFDPDGAGTEPAQTTYFSYQGGQIALQFDDPTLATTEPSHRYFWNPLAVDQLFADENTATSTVLWALTDQQGTVRDLATHDSGTGATTVVLHRDYDAWGNLTSATGSLLGDYDYAFNEQTHDIVNTIAATDELFGYTGRAFDVATGLQNNLNRWYDPKTGRWRSEDPIGFLAGDTNLQRYVGNSSTNLVDPSGLAPPASSSGMGRVQSAGTAALAGTMRCGQIMTWPARWFGADFSRQDALLNHLIDSSLSQNDAFGRGSMNVGAGMAAGGMYGAAALNGLAGYGVTQIGVTPITLGGIAQGTGVVGTLTAAQILQLINSSGDRVTTLFTRLSQSPAANRFLHTSPNVNLCNALQNSQATQLYVGRIPSDLFQRLLLDQHIYEQMVNMGNVTGRAYVITPQAMPILQQYFQQTGGDGVP